MENAHNYELFFNYAKQLVEMTHQTIFLWQSFLNNRLADDSPLCQRQIKITFLGHVTQSIKV